jgi:hypothetical protein
VTEAFPSGVIVLKTRAAEKKLVMELNGKIMYKDLEA